MRKFIAGQSLDPAQGNVYVVVEDTGEPDRVVLFKEQITDETAGTHPTDAAGKVEFVNKILDKKVNERNVAIAAQDIVVMNPVFPRLTPKSRNKELMMPADRVILEYRDKLREFEDRGWRIDLKAIRENLDQGDEAYAIPSPARRESKSWVLDPVPTCAAVPPPAAVGAAG